MPVTSQIVLAIERFIDDITNLSVDHPLDDALQSALMAEHEIRLLFASDQRNSPLQYLFLGLIDVFGLHPAARRTRERQIEGSGSSLYDRYIFPLNQYQRKLALRPSTVCNMEEFERNWGIFTHKALLKMTSKDWKNVIAAGGSVLACLIASNQNSSPQELNNYFMSNVYESSDIDLFLWGLTPEEAEAKMQDLYRAVCNAAAPWKVTCVRKANTVSLHTTYPFRPIQIVLRLYQSPAEILAGFDIDAACCAYDGNRVWVNPRSLTAIVRQSNTIDLTRRSPSYEMRLAKYAQRGFEIHVPNLRRERIRPEIYSRDIAVFPNGLARLLVLETAYYEPYFYRRLNYPKVHYLQQRTIFRDTTRQATDLPSNNYDGNLGWAQIPYGVFWDAERIEKLVSRKDAWMNSPYNSYNRGAETRHRHIFVAGTMHECIEFFCPDCDTSDTLTGVDAVAAPLPGIYIQGHIKFITVNPGQQLATGSFRPLEIGEWASEAYE